MKKFRKFRLSADFCMNNGVIILNQKQNQINFGLVRPEDTDLRMSLFQIFTTYLRAINIPKIPQLTFTLISQKKLLDCVLKLYSVENLKNFETENNDFKMSEKNLWIHFKNFSKQKDEKKS